MKRAIALVELLALMAIIAITSIAFASLIRPLVIEIPRTRRVVEANTSILNMLTHLRSDVEASARLPVSFENINTDNKNLLIELPDGLICYTIEKGKVVRKVLKGKESSRITDTWPVPRAVIEWKTWQKNGKSYAIEILSHIEYIDQGRKETKLANSHVYFVGASPEVLKKK